MGKSSGLLLRRQMRRGVNASFRLVGPDVLLARHSGITLKTRLSLGRPTLTEWRHSIETRQLLVELVLLQVIFGRFEDATLFLVTEL